MKYILLEDKSERKDLRFRFIKWSHCENITLKNAIFSDNMLFTAWYNIFQTFVYDREGEKILPMSYKRFVFSSLADVVGR